MEQLGNGGKKRQQNQYQLGFFFPPSSLSLAVTPPPPVDVVDVSDGRCSVRVVAVRVGNAEGEDAAGAKPIHPLRSVFLKRKKNYI